MLALTTATECSIDRARVTTTLREGVRSTEDSVLGGKFKGVCPPLKIASSEASSRVYAPLGTESSVAILRAVFRLGLDISVGA